jgi:hypothetical protein
MNKYDKLFKEHLLEIEAADLFLRLSLENRDDLNTVEEAYNNWHKAKWERWEKQPFVCGG